MRRWRAAMAAALYGPGGFFVRPGNPPAAHFRTSALASPRFAEAIASLLVHLDTALGHPDPLTVVDIGAGRGGLLTALPAAVPAAASVTIRDRLQLVAVELAPRPPELPTLVEWRREPPARVTGLVVATEWLDNVPVEVAEVDDAGVARYVLVDPTTGAETLGEPVAGPDAAWLARWWPLAEPGARAEIGRPRDEAWAAAVATLDRGAALAVDYGHLADDRPPGGTLTGYRGGRRVAPVPDGSCDLTAHVALDPAAEAGARSSPTTPATSVVPAPLASDATAASDAMPAAPVLRRQRDALRALGVSGARPPSTLAERDPVGYLRRLATAGEAAELTDPAGLGGHWWLLQPVRLAAPRIFPSASVISKERPDRYGRCLDAGRHPR